MTGGSRFYQRERIVSKLLQRAKKTLVCSGDGTTFEPTNQLLSSRLRQYTASFETLCSILLPKQSGIGRCLIRTQTGSMCLCVATELGDDEGSLRGRGCEKKGGGFALRCK